MRQNPFKIDTYNTNQNLGNNHSDEQITFKIDNYKMGKKNGLSIDSKLKTVFVNRQVYKGRINPKPFSPCDVNFKERLKYQWNLIVSN